MDYPRCERCGGEINPNKYEDCERAYRTVEGLLCIDCFKSHIEGRYSLDEIAEALGVVVVRL